MAAIASASQLHHVTLDGREIELHVRVNRRARRIILRYNPVERHLMLTLPRRVSVQYGLRFVESRHGWIRKTLSSEAPHVPIDHGAVLPLLGTEHRICHIPTMRGVVEIRDGQLHVSGAKEHMPRRVRDWLKNHLRSYVTMLTHEKARQIGKDVRSISIRDSRSRWGSCSRKGCITFSLRLVFAPSWIVDYIVSHEVAHLVEMNHSPRFWRKVEELCPVWKEAEEWLRRHSADLYRYGI